MINISEKSFEQTIEDTLIAVLPAKEGTISETAPNFTNFIPGSYRNHTTHPEPRQAFNDQRRIIHFSLVSIGALPPTFEIKNSSCSYA